MVRVGVRIISWCICFNFEKFIDCGTGSFIESLNDCRAPAHSVLQNVCAVSCCRITCLYLVNSIVITRRFVT